MTGSEERILGWYDLGADDDPDYEEVCVIARCGRPATRWIPSHIDGKLMPACEKHYNDPKMTPRRWKNARKGREDAIKELIGKRCCDCGKQALTSEDVNQTAAFEKYGNDFLDNDDLQIDYVPKIVWLCKACSLARIGA